jgi:hypothetical protein
VQRAPEDRDIYEESPGYGQDNLTSTRSDPNIDATQAYSDASVDTPPTYANVEMEQSHESAGTDIPGTSDPRGLGDNTDDR